MLSVFSPHPTRPTAVHRSYDSYRTYFRGQFLYLSRSEQSDIFIIKQGLVRLGTYAEDGEETTLAVLKPSDALGSLLAGPSPSKEFAQALSPVQVKAISHDTFHGLLAARPALTWELTHALGSRVQQVERHFRMLNLPRARTRLVAFLQFLAEQCGYEQYSSIIIDNFLTHEDIAKIINTSRQTVSACINHLERQGMLTYTRRTIALIANFPQVSTISNVAEA